MFDAHQKITEYLGGGSRYSNQQWTSPQYRVGQGEGAKTYPNVGGAIEALNQVDAVLNTRIDRLGSQMQSSYQETQQRIHRLEKRAKAGIAVALALDSAPYVAGKYSYAVGAANYSGENAIGATLRKTADNGRWSMTGGMSTATQGGTGVRIGVSGVLK